MENNYYNYTKKQLIRRIKMERVRPIFSKKYYNCTKKQINNFLKDRLVYLLLAQEIILPLFEKKNIPLDCQKMIFQNL